MFKFLVYNKFKQKKWEKLSPKKRLRAFQKMENIMARKVGRPKYTVLSREWEDGTMGLCSYSKKIIYIHTDFFVKDSLQFLGLATLFHEQRHAEQHHIVRTKKKIFKFSKAYKWQQNMKAYINYDGDEKYSYYSMQEIERDANKFAIKALKKFRFRFRKEENYFNSVAIKEKEYDLVKEKAKEELGLFYKFKLFLRRKKEERKND